MTNERANDLARQCTELIRGGNDFPTVWSSGPNRINENGRGDDISNGASN